MTRAALIVALWLSTPFVVFGMPWLFWQFLRALGANVWLAEPDDSAAAVGAFVIMAGVFFFVVWSTVLWIATEWFHAEQEDDQ